MLDEKTLAIPERLDSRRLDALLNILETGTVGLLFVVPGFEETLRVNGCAAVVRDADMLGRTAARGRTPTAAIGVEVEECFLTCAKTFKHLGPWREGEWPERSTLPALGRIFRDQGPSQERARKTWTAGSRRATPGNCTEGRPRSAVKDGATHGFRDRGR